MREALQLVLNRMLANRIFVVLLSGLALAVLFTLIVGFLVSAYAFSSSLPWIVVTQPRVDAILFAMAFFSFSFVLYFISYREREDLLTPLRKQLRGVWRVTYSTWGYNSAGELVPEEHADVCVMGIDETTAKLFIKSKIEQSKIYEESVTRIDDVNINPSIAPKRLTYYHMVTVRYRQEVADQMKLPLQDVSGPIFCILEFVHQENSAVVAALKGSWYDLEGVFAKMREQYAASQGISPKERSPRKGQILFSRVNEET